LKTRKCHFQTINLALSTVAAWLPTGLLGVPPNSCMNIGRNVVVASKSGPVETGPTIPVAMALINCSC